MKCQSLLILRTFDSFKNRAMILDSLSCILDDFFSLFEGIGELFEGVGSLFEGIYAVLKVIFEGIYFLLRGIWILLNHILSFIFRLLLFLEYVLDYFAEPAVSTEAQPQVPDLSRSTNKPQKREDEVPLTTELETELEVGNR